MPDEVPDISVIPAQDRIDPHQLGPIRVCGAELFLRCRIGVTVSSPQNGGLNVRPVTQHLLEAFLHGSADVDDFEVIDDPDIR